MAARVEHTPEELTALRAEVERSELDLGHAKVAYFNSTPYKDAVVDYDRLRAFAEAFIRANHAYQKALYGKIQVRLDVSRLLRE